MFHQRTNYLHHYLLGGHHNCLVTASGAAKCWGYNTYGQLGYQSIYSSETSPVDVTNLDSGVASVAVAYR